MDFKRTAYDQVPFLSTKDLAYINEVPELRKFYQHDVSLEAFKDIIDNKTKQSIDRSMLVEVLTDQYKSNPVSGAVQKNIESLARENTFTVITAHQPALFTGPLYFIYKICSAIHLSQLLNQHYPDFHFVPLFILGGEDHDFEEINHLQVYGKTIKWNHPHPGGPVGRMDMTGMDETINELENILGTSDASKDIINQLRKFFDGSSSYGESMRQWVHHLFQRFGLVIISTDDRRIKRAFKETMLEELIQKTSYQIVKQTQEALDQIGFSDQAFAREINLFYVEEGMRERIVEENGKYRVGKKTFSKDELVELMETAPEHFSPNVILRPLFQESIFPNLAYIGGGGEIAYWLERKHQFEHYGIPYPMLIRRNSAVCLSPGIQKNIAKTGLQIEDFFVRDINQFLTKWVAGEQAISMDTYRAELEKIVDQISQEASEIDATLKQYVGAEGSKMAKSLDNIEKRLMKAVKGQQEVSINRIRNIYEKLFPELSLQERKENFLSIYVKLGDRFIDALVENLNPLDKQFTIVLE